MKQTIGFWRLTLFLTGFQLLESDIVSMRCDVDELPIVKLAEANVLLKVIGNIISLFIFPHSWIFSLSYAQLLHMRMHCMLNFFENNNALHKSCVLICEYSQEATSGSAVSSSCARKLLQVANDRMSQLGLRNHECLYLWGSILLEQAVRENTGMLLWYRAQTNKA